MSPLTWPTQTPPPGWATQAIGFPWLITEERWHHIRLDVWPHTWNDRTRWRPRTTWLKDLATQASINYKEAITIPIDIITSGGVSATREECQMSESESSLRQNLLVSLIVFYMCRPRLFTRRHTTISYWWVHFRNASVLPQDRTINRSVVRPIVRSFVVPNDVESQVTSLSMTIVLVATDLLLAITHDLCDQSCVLYTICLRFQIVLVAATS